LFMVMVGDCGHVFLVISFALIMPLEPMMALGYLQEIIYPCRWIFS